MQNKNKVHETVKQETLDADTKAHKVTEETLPNSCNKIHPASQLPPNCLFITRKNLHSIPLTYTKTVLLFTLVKNHYGL